MLAIYLSVSTIKSMLLKYSHAQRMHLLVSMRICLGGNFHHFTPDIPFEAHHLPHFICIFLSELLLLFSFSSLSLHFIYEFLLGNGNKRSHCTISIAEMLFKLIAIISLSLARSLYTQQYLNTMETTFSKQQVQATIARKYNSKSLRFKSISISK